MKLKSVFTVAVAVIFTLAAVVSVVSVHPTESGAGQLKTFTSLGEMKDYIHANREMSGYGYPWYFGMFRAGGDIMVTAAPESTMKEAPSDTGIMKLDSSAENGGGADFSTTNIQVEGVDEADIVKNDGKYLYAVSAGKVLIIEAYPAREARILSRISCQGSPVELFVHGNRLAIVENNYATGEVVVNVYDISAKEKPEQVRTLDFKGSLVSSRLIGDYAYFVASIPVGTGIVQKDGKEDIQLPVIDTGTGKITVAPAEIAYFDYPDSSYVFTVILSVNLSNDQQKVAAKTFLTGISQNLYVSRQNIYLTNQKNPDLAVLTNKYIDGLAGLVPADVAARLKTLRASKTNMNTIMGQVEDVLEGYLNSLGYSQSIAFEEKIQQYREKYQRDIERDRDNTIIHKLSVQGGSVAYVADGEIPGQLLNQFSMDENGEYLRVATTSTGFLFGNGNTKNNIFVLDGKLQITGRLQGLARSERIYAARFLGDRVYLVTFRRVDPFFVIDLKDPKNPKVLGELKIPGYSDYLHPYDENHIIGIGKDVPEAGIPGPPVVRPMARPEAEIEIVPPLVRPGGLKIALFDVSNPEKPREISKFVVDQPSSDSEALRDHRAFLFSKSKNLLVLPVTYWVQTEINTKAIWPGYQHFWQGAYVFDVSPSGGIALKGKIMHEDDRVAEKGAGGAVRRSMYIEDVLYTLSDGMLKANDLDSLKEVKSIRLEM
ncbi:MAG: hypothetical protein VR69_14220 [Peptococcaceae bacterium BRH_c4b]|nr:MAG: hypothetical protein VR69_14220 [Peptococcaceae bacterium BRH_c4b]